MKNYSKKKRILIHTVSLVQVTQVQVTLGLKNVVFFRKDLGMTKNRFDCEIKMDKSESWAAFFVS